MATTEILPFATAGGANVMSQVDYDALAARLTGFVAGIASSEELNKVWRQSAFLAAGIANWIVSKDIDVPDDGNVLALVAKFEAAIAAGYASNRFARQPCVTMIRRGDVWTVYDENGEPIDTTGTTTEGLQEAIDYACTPSGTEGFDLYVFGGDETTPGGASVLNCTTTVQYPPVQGKVIDIGSVTINFGAVGSINGIVFDSCMMMNYAHRGQVVYSGTGIAVQFNPINNVPVDALAAITDSKFYINAVASNGLGSTAVQLYANTAPILNSKFEFVEVNGDRGALSGTTRGIILDNGTLGGQSIIHNDIRCYHLHECKDTSLQIGTVLGDMNYGNVIEAHIITKNGATGPAILVYGKNNHFTVSIDGIVDVGIQLESSAAKNVFNVLRHDNSVTPVVDNSTTKDNAGLHGSWLTAAGTDLNSVTQAGIVHDTYTKLALVDSSANGFDYGSAFAANKWTPGRAGLARINARASWVDMNDQGQMFIAIYKNGGRIYESVATASGTAGDQGPEVDRMVVVSAPTDYFEIFVKQMSGGNRDISGAISKTCAQFQMVG